MEHKKTLLSKDYFNDWSYEDLLTKASSTEEADLLALDSALRKMMANNKDLTYTQLRVILNEVKKVPLLSKNIHKLAYIQARQDKANAALLVEFIRELMETAVETNKKDAFKDILNTIVAYHKFYSRKN